MFADPGHRPASVRRKPRGTAGHLRDGLAALAGGCGTVLRHDERPWASVTFEGTRHTLEIAFEGEAGIAAGEALIETLGEHEFVIPGQLVAEARVIAVDHRLAPQPRLQVTCELLLLKDA